jgi:di/tricarboxylate transporter
LVELPRLGARRRGEALQEIGAAEVMLAPESQLSGKTLRDVEFATRYRVAALGARHRGEPLGADLRDRPLGFGDTLLIAGHWDELSRLWEDRRNFVLLTMPAEYHERLPARRLAPVALVILLAMIVAMASGLMPSSAAALLAALAMIATGCVKPDDAYNVISWKTIVLVAGMLPLATALAKTGATALMAHTLVDTLGVLGPLAMLALTFLLTALVSLFISNSATAVLVAPVAIEAAQTLGVSPQAFAMTVAIACCAAYVTPVSSPGNMLVMDPGGYTFGDYVRIGLPLVMITMTITVALVAVIYGT